MEEQYRLGAAELKKVRENLVADRIAEKEIIGSAVGSMQETARELKKKVLYEFGSLSKDELELLTDRQRQIAELRQRYTYGEIAEKIGLSPSAVFQIFQQAVRKVRKARRQKKENIPPGLSPQQEKIYIFYQQGKKPAEIARMIGSDHRSVHTQLRRIAQKVDKNVKNAKG
jgi:DNA-binding NarL/FixJ family response regulator